MRTLGMGRHVPSLDTIAMGQTVLVALLLVTQFVPQPRLSSGIPDQGGLEYGVPLASFVVMALSLAAGFGMLLTGAFRSGARLRYGILAVLTLLLAIQPVTSLISVDAGRGYSLVLAFSAAQLAVLAVWWRWSTRPVLVWVLLPVYYLLVAGVWLVFAVHGRAAAGTGVVLHGLAAALLLLPLVLVFPILAFSTDWVNRVQGTARRALLLRDPRGRRWPHWGCGPRSPGTSWARPGLSRRTSRNRRTSANARTSPNPRTSPIRGDGPGWSSCSASWTTTRTRTPVPGTIGHHSC